MGLAVILEWGARVHDRSTSHMPPYTRPASHIAETAMSPRGPRVISIGSHDAPPFPMDSWGTNVVASPEIPILSARPLLDRGLPRLG
jgi:hypothetical protein